jgi:predicted MPP superfamily phosphohydrolase
MDARPATAWRRYGLAGNVSSTLTCIVLSDLHIGSHGGDLERLSGIVDEVLARRPGLVLLGGDYVNMQVFGGGRVRPEEIAEIPAPLARAAPVAAVLGNHDAEYGVSIVAETLEAVGIPVLLNAVQRLDTDSGMIDVAGLEDHRTGQQDTAGVFARLSDPSRTLVLAHDPASFAAVPAGPIVTVSGHTHGGHIRLPGLGAIVNASRAPLRWTHGHIIEGKRHLVVSAGLGTSVLPLRLNCPPEIAELVIEPR